VPVIRAASRDDAALLLRLIQESFETVYLRLGITAENWPRHAANMGPEWVLGEMDEGNRFFILEDCGQACGCIAMRQADADSVLLRRLAVLPAHRGKGWGRMLVAHVIAEARRLAARRVTLGMWAPEHELRRWYERQGFVYTETRSYEGLPLPVVHMALDLGAA